MVVEVAVVVSLPEVTGTGLACKHSSQGCGGLRPEEVRVYIRFISQLLAGRQLVSVINYQQRNYR